MSANKVIITAADSKYFLCLVQFINSFLDSKEIDQSRLVIYNLGLTQQQIDYINEKASLSKIELKHPKFDQYPEFVAKNLKVYAWKPILIIEEINTEPGLYLWLDSAAIILRPLDRIWQQIASQGQYVPTAGSSSLDYYTHSETLRLLAVDDHIKTQLNRSGNLCGFSSQNKTIMDLLNEWKKLCLIPELITPEGSNRSNHRWDQSILSILLYKTASNNALKLTADAVNISSGYPISEISVRNIIRKKFPFFMMPIVKWYFLLERRIDVLINRLKGIK